MCSFHVPRAFLERLGRSLAGNRHELETENRFAVVLQHEIDHINGILFLDHLSPLKRALYKKKVKKWHAEEQT